ncbi:MAG: helix-turn-helix domain-containing protein [Planctomycetia bacterium]|nr:helix-turn-helix domain-containing protein [Planctomycetia bacterium]
MEPRKRSRNSATPKQPSGGLNLAARQAAVAEKIDAKPVEQQAALRAALLPAADPKRKPKRWPTLDVQLRKIIGKVGISQNQLAKLAGVPQSALSRFIDGGDIRIDTATKLADALGIEFRVHLQGDENPAAP